MFARNVRWAALLLFAFAVCTSCSRQDELAGEVARGEEIVTAVGVSVPELFKTRTDVYDDVYGDGERYLGTSGMPSIGNVDLQAHPLTFTVGVYVKKKSGDGYALVDKQSHTATDDNAYFEFRLLKDQKYRLVAYADFNAAPKDTLESISYTTVLNDELSDAFFASEDFVAAENIQVVLKRPFGKLRLVAHDFNTLAAGGASKINKVKVTYKGATMLATNTFDALNGKFISKETAEGETVEGGYKKDADGNYPVEADPVVYTKEYTAEGKADGVGAGNEDPVAVFTMYLPANYSDDPTANPSAGPQAYIYPFDVTVEYENVNTPGAKTIERSFTIDIPVKRNWLTTVDATHFWTGKSGVMVTVDAAFDGEIVKGEEEEPTVKNATDLQAAIEKIFQEAPAGKFTKRTIVLGADIDATDRVGFNLHNYRVNANGSITELSNRGVEVHLDLNGHTITTNGTVYPKFADGLFNVQGVNCKLYIDDTSGKVPVGGLKFVGDYSHAYPLVYCQDGGQVTINRGNFVTSSLSEAVYIKETEQHRARVQLWCLQNLKIKPTDPKPTDPKKLESIERNVKKWSASATINGGWFENGYTGPVDDKNNVLINSANAREYKEINPTTGEKEGYWAQYSHYVYDKGYPEWTKWGLYVNQPFSFMFVNGGSFVGFDPSKGDNIVGNIPNKWIGNGHVQTETVNGKTVYTVIPKDVEHEF